MAERLSQHGIEMLDAPVSGGPAGAQQATLSIMAGGKPEVFERVRPLFDCLGKAIQHMGDHGAGQTTKACNQLALLVAAQGAAEALSLARACARSCACARSVLGCRAAGARSLRQAHGRARFRGGSQHPLHKRIS